MSMNRRRLLLRHEYNKYIHFEDKEVERICIEKWDKDGDGKLSKEEAAQVEYLGDLTLPKEANFAFRHVVDGVIDGDFAVEQRGLVLCEVTDLHIVAEGERALVFELLHDALDERRLTFAVATDES